MGYPKFIKDDRTQAAIAATCRDIYGVELESLFKDGRKADDSLRRQLFATACAEVFHLNPYHVSVYMPYRCRPDFYAMIKRGRELVAIYAAERRQVDAIKESLTTNYNALCTL